MSIIDSRAEAYWAAKEREKKKESVARLEAFARTMNSNNEVVQEMRERNFILRTALFAAIAFNFYAAAKGWGLL